jgi:hypothetical protein
VPFRDWRLTIQVPTIELRDRLIEAVAGTVSSHTAVPAMPVREIAVLDSAVAPSLTVTVRSWDPDRPGPEVRLEADAMLRRYASDLSLAEMTTTLDQQWELGSWS